MPEPTRAAASPPPLPRSLPQPEPEPEPEPMAVLHGLIFTAANTRAEHKWQDAVGLYRVAIEQGQQLQVESSVLADLYSAKSECHEHLEEFDDVLFDLSAAARLAGNASYIQRRRRAAVLLMLGRYPEARDELKEALESCPAHFAERAEMEAELGKAHRLVSAQKRSFGRV